MPNYIKPTFTLTANKNSNTNSPGPLSVALSLNASDTLSVDTVTSEIITVSTAQAILIDGSATNGGPGTGGTAGGYIWMKNTTASGNNLIYIGTNTSANDAAVDLIGSPGANVNRLFTLKVGEFAWMPFDYNMDIIVDANAADQQLEYWIFDRG
tara:strand:- start:203 stop:664 length:462 start_codon:yes stop_codon:yes gene_type:complete